jgi:hypothetical protein
MAPFPFRRLISEIKQPSDSRAAPAIGIILLAIALFVVFVLLTPWILAQSSLAKAQAGLIQAGLPPALTKGVIWLLGIPFALSLFRLMTPFPTFGKAWPRSRRTAMVTAGSLVALFYGGDFTLRNMTGVHAGEYYCPGAPGSGRGHFLAEESAAPGPKCPIHLVPVRLAAAGDGTPPETLAVGANGPFVDQQTGYTLVWFGRHRGGRLVPYNKGGIDPATLDSLMPASKTLVVEYQDQWTREDAVLGTTRESGRRSVSSEPSRSGSARIQPGSEGRAVTNRTQGKVHPGWAEKEMGELLDMASMDPNNANLHLYIAKRYEEQGSRSDAIEQYHLALQHDPALVDAKDALARLGETP